MSTKIFYNTLLLASTFFFALITNAQNVIAPLKPNWQNLDLANDGVLGISTEKAYTELLKGKPHKPVIVAVVDGGVDINHEDLRNVIYTNLKEVAANQQDDDKNGYKDDLHGWNFIGSAKGEVHYDNLEVVRLVREQSSKFEQAKRSSFKGEELAAYKKYNEMKADIEKRTAAAQANLQGLIRFKRLLSDTLLVRLKRENATSDDLKKFYSRNYREYFVVQTLINHMVLYGNVNDFIKFELDYPIQHYQEQLYYNLNINFNSRDTVGDNYADSKESAYGNANVTGPDADHGSHVAGIIAASRDNDLGIKGVANDVSIMSVRTVPVGDERDKDVANAIRYAVNNGAKIINMSFGKAYSYNKQVVDEAVKYAMGKGVLIVHAAGNENQDNDILPNFPNRIYEDKTGIAPAWIEVGASGPLNTNEVKAIFSNYGKTSVDVFAPGVNIRSATPNSTYSIKSGTSMAAPVVTGLAALIWSYYPKLTALQVKEIILKSVQRIDNAVVVKTEDSAKNMLFTDLCISGGIVNAYNALQLAATY